MTFYNSQGKPIAYSENGTDIYLFNGHPVAYLYADAVYSYSGKHLGWFEKGWIRDKKGYCVFFTENSTGSGPVKPVKQICSVKSVKSIKPIKNSRQSPCVKAADNLSWSSFSNERFFQQ